MRLSDIGAAVLNLLYPEDVVCFCCNKPARADEYGVCENCAGEIRTPGDLDAPEGIAGFTAGFLYDEAVQQAIHRLKFSNARYLGRSFARFIHIPPGWGADCIVPVPLHKKRFRERGYNQSGLIAAELSKRLCIPLEEGLLSRVVETSAQSMLNGAQREQNVRHAFKATPAVRGRTPLLIDDVKTTGSTMSACAHALLDAGAARVYAASACVAQLWD